MTITQHLLDTDGTVIKELTGLSERGWTDPRRGAGAGSLTIRNDHPDAGTVTKRRYIRCSLDGTPAFTWMLQEPSRRRLSQEGPGGKVTVWTGAGGLSALGMGDHHAAVVVGDGNSGLKTIGWMGESWDDSGWSEPTDRGFVDQLLPDDTEWPDPDAQFLGSSGSGPASYLRRFLDTDATPAVVTGDRIRLYAVAKGAYTVWFDGREVTAGDPWQVTTVDLDPLELGGHQLAMEVESGSGALSLIALDADGNLKHVIYRSFTQSVYGTGNPDPWVGLEGGSSPAGVTAGLAAALLLDEAQARSAATAVSWTFTDSLDSDGNGWTVSLPSVRYRDGKQLGDVIMEMTQQFSVDVRMSPSLELQIVETLGSDLSSTVQATDGTPAAAAADLNERGPRGNAVRIGTSGGYGWDPSASGIPAGATQRLETAAGFGTAGSTDEVLNAAQELIDELRGAVRQQLTTSGPSGFRPYTDFNPGDHIGVAEEDGGAYLTSRVEQITVLDLPAGEQEFIIDTERRL